MAPIHQESTLIFQSYDTQTQNLLQEYYPYPMEAEKVLTFRGCLGGGG